MTEKVDGRKKPQGQGFAFGGPKAEQIKARMKALREEQKRTGRISIFDRTDA